MNSLDFKQDVHQPTLTFEERASTSEVDRSTRCRYCLKSKGMDITKVRDESEIVEANEPPCFFVVGKSLKS